MANENIKSNPTVNAVGTVRRVQHDGRDTIVAPVILMVEGVHNGSGGALLYPAEELKASADKWDGVPLPINHPTDTGGSPISCNSPEVLESHSVGVVRNVVYSDQPTPRLKGEIYADVERLKKVNAAVLDALMAGTPMDVSTGLFSFDEDVEGIWNNEQYIGIVKQIIPDHLALLPTSQGACSWADGCGIRANEGKKMNILEKLATWFKSMGVDLVKNDLNFSDQEYALRQLICTLDTKTTSHYVCDVFDDYFIYETYPSPGTEGSAASKKFKQGWALDAKGLASFVGAPIEVTQVTEYVPTTNAGSGIKTKDAAKTNATQTKEEQMNRKEKVDALISNGAFTEEDRGVLENCDCPTFTRIEALAARPVKANAEPEAPTFEALMERAPDEVKAQYAAITNAAKEHRDGIIAKIKANANNKLTEEMIANMSTDVLGTIADSIVPVVNYAGQSGGAAPIGNTEPTEAPMELPAFASKK